MSFESELLNTIFHVFVRKIGTGPGTILSALTEIRCNCVNCELKNLGTGKSKILKFFPKT